MFPTEITTDRLRLERLDRAVDVHELYAVCSDPEMSRVTEHMPWSPHGTPKETAEFLTGQAEAWEADETATYALHPRTGEDGAGDLAGVGSLDVDWDRRLGTLGVWLRPRFWGRGYSGERAAALLDLAFEVLDLEVVAVSHVPENERSERAIERYVEAHGGRRVGRLRNHVPHLDGAWDAVRYSVSATEYEAARDRQPHV